MLKLNVISLFNYISYNIIIFNNHKDEITEILENNKEVKEKIYKTDIRLKFHCNRLIV